MFLRDWYPDPSGAIAANHTVGRNAPNHWGGQSDLPSVEGLIDSIGIETDAPNGGLCVAYFDGDYPTPLYDYEEDYRRSLEEKTSFYKWVTEILH